MRGHWTHSLIYLVCYSSAWGPARLGAVVVCGRAPQLSVRVERRSSGWVKEFIKEFGIRSSYVHVGPHVPLGVLQFNFQMILMFVLYLKEMWESVLMISCKCIYLPEIEACWMKGQLGLWGCFYRNTTDPKQGCQSGRALLRSIKVQKLFYKVPNRGISALLPKLLHLLQWEQVTLRAQLQPTHTHTRQNLKSQSPGDSQFVSPVPKGRLRRGFRHLLPFSWH